MNLFPWLSTAPASLATKPIPPTVLTQISFPFVSYLALNTSAWPELTRLVFPNVAVPSNKPTTWTLPSSPAAIPPGGSPRLKSPIWIAQPSAPEGDYSALDGAKMFQALHHKIG